MTRSRRSLTIVTGMSGSPRPARARTRLAAAAAQTPANPLPMIRIPLFLLGTTVMLRKSS
jgi:hypothetical protein